MNYAKNISKYIIILLNIGLTVFFSGVYYSFIGVGMGIISLGICLLCKDNAVGYFIINSQIKSYSINFSENEKDENTILISIAFLIISLKIGAAIALIVEGAAIVVIAFAILVASGWLIEGKRSGMTVGLAYSIAKIVMRIYLFITSFTDKLAMLMVKIEFSILGIKEV